MTERNKCGNCAFYAEQTDVQNIGHKQGACHYNPPVSNPVATPQGTGVVTIRPLVTPEEWCGQWKEELIL